MPVLAYRPPSLVGAVFRGTTAVRRGLLTAAQLQGQAWRRVRHDVYADARLMPDHGLACRAALLRLPAGTTLAGQSAAYLHGIRHAATFDDDVHVIAPAPVRLGAQQRLRVHHVELRPAEIVTAPGLPRTTATRTAWDVASWLDPTDSVPIIDSLLRRGLTTRAELTALVRPGSGGRGWRRAELAFGLAVPAAESPPESVLRVRLVLAGLPRPVAQCAVRVRPGLVLHPDLAWERWRVAVEYDGHWHADPEQLHRDRRRLNQLAVAGWTVLHVTSRRLHNDFPAVVTEIRSALTARGWRPTTPDQLKPQPTTEEPPP